MPRSILIYDPKLRQRIIGPNGKTIRRIVERWDVHITFQDDQNTVTIFGDHHMEGLKAVQRALDLRVEQTELPSNEDRKSASISKNGNNSLSYTFSPIYYFLKFRMYV